MMLPLLLLLAQTPQPPAPRPTELRQIQQVPPGEQSRAANTEVQVNGQPATRSNSTPINWSNWIIAAFTIVIALAAIGQMRIYGQMLKMNGVVERAWVSLETLNIRVYDSRMITRPRTITVGFKNSGHMPARIIEANITVRGGVIEGDNGAVTKISDLPDAPVYDKIELAPPAILVAGEISRMRHTFTHSGDKGEHFGLMVLTPGEKRDLWIYGYIKYTDGLSDHVREYRWARKYDPLLSSVRGAFRFAHVNKPQYNRAD
jgi:hypothetical protein